MYSWDLLRIEVKGVLRINGHTDFPRLRMHTEGCLREQSTMASMERNFERGNILLHSSIK
jgi:hypothetical protein